MLHLRLHPPNWKEGRPGISVHLIISSGEKSRDVRGKHQSALDQVRLSLCSPLNETLRFDFRFYFPIVPASMLDSAALQTPTRKIPAWWAGPKHFLRTF